MSDESIKRLLAAYPRVRPPLPEALAAIYEDIYRSNREGRTAAASLSQKLEGWLHRMVAQDCLHLPSAKSTLELGAGTLNQLEYEPQRGLYDIVEPFRRLYESRPALTRIGTIYADIGAVPASSRYDRITSVATLEHLTDLPFVVAKSALHLSADGVFRAAIPGEGGLLWWLGWNLTTGLEFRLRHGLDYGDLMRHEHVNTADEIFEILGYFFGRVETRVFGLTKRLSIYRFHACTAPNVERCVAYLAAVGKAWG
ncbi:MAG: class I SAM-dependent methyltransferase [Betaproteobacteria bacterium]|nr:class I SAM-dependent methyltransferase [Betaproteobacteria bacterium]